MPLTCQHCGCSDIDTDPARGDAVCTGCGSVLEDNIIVSEVQFEEGSHGGSRAIGQMVSADGHASGGLNMGFQHGMGKESRLITIQKARNKISQMAAQLHLNQHCVEMACNFYKMALTRRLTRGRKSTHTIAACVYMVCRIEETPHMLLDLSDIVQVNVYELGRTYLHLSAALCLNIPWIDPCLYIVRFAHRLEFGDKTHEVSMTAHRLVQRMKRDWMHTGRRPSGLCGAALLVAGRMHEFNRTIKDIIKVVKVCESTLRKRLSEFGETPSGHLTLDEFMAIDLEEEQDPPCFKEARKKLKNPPTEESEEMSQEIIDLQTEIERALEERRKKLHGPYAKYAEVPELVEESQVTENFIVQGTLDSIEELIRENPDEPLPSSEETVDGMADSQNLSQEEIQSTAEVLNDILLPSPDSEFIPTRDRSLCPTAESLGLRDSIEDCMKVKEVEVEVQDGGELDLTDIDDKELDAYIMTESEVKAKTQLWLEVHAEYLEEMKEKEAQQEREAEENAKKPEPKKRKKTTRKRSNVQASSAGEAIEKMLQEKKISSKINYEVLKSLNTTEIRADKDTFLVPAIPASPVTPRTPRKDLVKANKSKEVAGTPPQAICGLMSSIISSQKKHKVEDDDDSGPIKKAKIEIEPKPEVLVIDPPIEEEEFEEEEEEEEEAPPEEEKHFSAAQLLEQYHGEEDGDYYDDQNDYFDES